MNTPNLDNFIKGWIALFACSPKTRLEWRTRTGLPPPSYLATRWWSRFEVIKQVLSAFGDIEPFLNTGDISPTTSNKLLEILRDLPTQRRLKIKLAMTVDSMEPFVKACYALEVDGPLALIAL